ncbi:MAG TPA: hypothetical protein DCL16_08290 [Acidimicrobiaceae bacterium]|nr:hypothetical protein [Acidimicrobiaceae bacterium]
MSISDPIHRTVLSPNSGGALTQAVQSSLPFAPGLKGWEQIAACRGIDSSVFFPDDEDDNAELAKQICHGCSVATPCLEYAITVREKEGVWGGATQRERRSIIRRRRRAAARQRTLRETETTNER